MIRNMRIAVLAAWGAALPLFSSEPAGTGPETQEQVAGEITPIASAWVDQGRGLEAQITVPEATADVRGPLPVLVWFRNTSAEVREARCVAPAFSLHGTVFVRWADGKNVITGECLKEHALANIPVLPGTTRVFRCDAFTQLCHGVADNLAPGVYTVALEGGNEVQVTLVKRLSDWEARRLAFDLAVKEVVKAQPQGGIIPFDIDGWDCRRAEGRWLLSWPVPEEGGWEAEIGFAEDGSDPRVSVREMKGGG